MKSHKVQILPDQKIFIPEPQRLDEQACFKVELAHLSVASPGKEKDYLAITGDCTVVQL